MSDSVLREILGVGSHFKYLLDDLRWLVKIYDFHLHTCAHFANKEKPTINLKVYPDTVVLYNFRFDFDEPYFYDGLDVKLIKGSSVWNDAMKSTNDFLEKIAQKLGVENYASIIVDLIDDYIGDKLNLFQYGIHWFQDFRYGTYEQMSDESEKHRRWVEGRIEMYVAGMVLVEVALLVFTRGRGLAGKLKTVQKGKKYAKMLDLMHKDDIEIVTPKIAETSRVGFEQTGMGTVSYVYRYKLKAAPLFGIKFEIKEISINQSTRDRLYNKDEEYEKDYGKLKDKIVESALGEVLPVNASFDMSVYGNIGFEYEVKYDYLYKKLVVTDKTINKEFKDGTRFNTEGAIKIKLGIKLKNDTKIRWKPFIVPLVTIEGAIEGQLDAEVSGGFKLQVRFFLNVTDPYYEWVLIFSGFKGEYYQKVKVETRDENVLFDTNEDQEDGKPQPPKPFTIMDKSEYVIKRVYL